jgi:pimeloyl-ACP methyl ester carboxylesterase
VNSYPIMTPMFQFLSHDAAGLAIAAIVGVIGGLFYWRRLRKLGTGIIVAALLLAAGSISHLLDAASFARANPAPGRFVEAAGMRVHILAEGNSAAGRPTIVWFGGAHSGGAAMSHLHRMIKGEFRSVLIDRPGSGWSGIASFPRTTATEADEMWQVLAAAGERGPFVLVGHSFGGLLAVNMARREPGRVAALVLLDATPPDVIVYGPDLGAGQLSGQAFMAGVAQLFGIDLETLLSGQGPVNPLEKIIAAQLGHQGDVMKAQSKLPRAQMAGASIYSELAPAGMAKDAWNMTVYDGELDGMPVYLVAPDTLPPAAALPQASATERNRLLNLLKRGRERYMAVSDRSQRIVAPAGTGHNFIYESPQTVVDAVRMAAGPQAEPVN